MRRRRQRSMERRKVTHHPLVEIGLVRMDRLSMLYRDQMLLPTRSKANTYLAKVVETRKLLSAVAGKRALAGVFPGPAEKSGEHVGRWVREKNERQNVFVRKSR